MGTNIVRVPLVNGINQAFDAQNIAATAQALLPLAQGADFLSILHELGLLAPVLSATTPLAQYRKQLTMPELTRQVMTGAFRAALLNDPPLPLHLTIRDGAHEAIETSLVHDPDARITVLLTRTDPPVKSAP